LRTDFDRYWVKMNDDLMTGFSSAIEGGVV